MQEINLLQSKIKDRQERWQKNNRTANIVLFLILIIVLAVGGLFMYLNSGSADKLRTVASDTAKAQSEIDAQQETLHSAENYQAQLKNLQLVLNNHVAWSNFFKELGDYTLKGITYTSMHGNLTDTVHLEGQTKTYTEMAKLLLGLSTSKNFEKVDLLSTGPSSNENFGYIFSVDLTVAPNLFTPR